MKIGIAVLATNGYFLLGCRFINRFHHFYKGDADIIFYFFGNKLPYDHVPSLANVRYYDVAPSDWVSTVNTKYANMIRVSDPVDYLYFFDADTNINNDFNESWFIGDMVAGQHWGHINTPIENLPFDRYDKSSCYIPLDSPLEQKYYYGAFFGGTKENVFKFCNEMIVCQIKNRGIGHEPLVNDDSYTNYYFHYNPPTKVIPATEFEFAISCKGGLDIERRHWVSFPDEEEIFLKNKNKLLNIQHGDVLVN